MVMPRLIPCLDVANGRVVKGTRFRDLRDSGDPVELAARYEAQGADELCLLDIAATPDGAGSALDVVRRVRAVLGIPLTVGGGVRTYGDAAALLDAGADRVAVNSAAFARPALVAEIAERLGRQCAVLSLDAARRLDGPGFEVVTHGGRRRTGADAVAWAAEAAALGAGEVLATSHDRDGTQAGYDLDLIRALRAALDVPIVASGGARSAAHMAAALDAGASATLAASILHDGLETVASLKASLLGAGVPVRTTP